MAEQGRGVAQGVGREVRGQRVAYGFGARTAFQPGGDSGGESPDIAFGEEEAGVVVVERGEEVGGGAL